MATKIWDAAAATPTGTHRIPADTSAAGGPTRYTVQQLADLKTSVGITANALGNVTGATSISLASGGIVTATVTGNTTFTFDNPPAGATEWTLVLTNGGAFTITWPTTTWAGATAPTLTASGVDVLKFTSPNGGTTWYGWHERDEPSSGLSEPLTVTRATRQSSALTAASAGETKLQFCDIVRAGLLACRTDIGDSVILFPPLTHPFLTGAWFSSGSGSPPSKGVGSNLFGGAFAASVVLNSVGAVNIPSGGSAGQEGIWYANSYTARDGSAAGDGYLMWGLVGFPDASYGSGSTGAVNRMGLYASGSIPTTGARASGRSCLLEWSTVQSDTNWMLAIHDGTNIATADTGLAFAGSKDWFYMIHSPRGGTDTYAYIANLTDGTSGSASLSRNTGSTALSRYCGVLTRTSVVRNVRFASQFVLHGGQI